MREIKFRAWDKLNKKMIVDEDNLLINLSGDVVKVWDDGEWANTINGLNYILMQYTGLKDKNGKEIWEGDVVEFYYLGTHRDVVRYIVDGFKVNTTGHTDDVKTELCLGFPFREMEIIGNVWENPNLIK